MTNARPHVVIVGAGFGGLETANSLARADVDVTLIDQRNHHVFQPLLYQVATAALSPADIAGPIRSIVSGHPNIRVLLDRVMGVNKADKSVALSSGRDVAYDWLVIATGARHSYFGHDEWAQHAPGLKTLDDATAVRRKVLLALERAETETDPDRRQALLTFVVVGGGPTGVEMAGAIAELATRSVSRDFRSITPHCSRVVLIDAAPRLLTAFPPNLSAAAQRAIEHLGVEVRLNAPVSHIAADRVEIGHECIPTHTIVWAAGVRASRVAEWLNLDCDPAGRIHVGPDLRAPQSDHIFVIGDAASCVGPDGRPLPGVAPVAKQQGRHVARTIVAAEHGRAIGTFRYRNYGNLATIGRKRAVIDFGRIHVTGFPAWVLWSVAHVFFLVGFRNRFAVGIGLFWNYLTYARHARLITGDIHETTQRQPILQEI